MKYYIAVVSALVFVVVAGYVVSRSESSVVSAPAQYNATMR